MYGLFIGLAVALLGYFSGSMLTSLHYASLFWLAWYGLWQTVTGGMSLLTVLGITGGGTVVGGAVGGMLGGLLVGLLGGSFSLLILVGWVIKTALLVGGAYLMFSEAADIASIDDINYLRFGGGLILMLFGVFMGRSSPSTSSRRSR